jgi:hypothetical protein
MPLMTALLALTVVVAVAELFAVLLSLGEVTVAVLDSDVGLPGAVTTRSKLAEAPAARAARVQVTGDDALQVQPVPLAETNVVPAGIVSETLTVVAATVAELFVTVIVYVSVPLMATGSGLSVFVIERSAT